MKTINTNKKSENYIAPAKNTVVFQNFAAQIYATFEYWFLKN